MFLAAPLTYLSKLQLHLVDNSRNLPNTTTMAAAQFEAEDALYNLRLSIKASGTPILSTSADPTPADIVPDLAVATHVTFNVEGAHRTFPLTCATRFAPENKPVDLRSCYFAWLNKDASVTDYFAAVQTLNEELPSGAGGSAQNLTFAQKIELIAWLSGETESSDSIVAIDGAAATAAAGDAAAIAGGKGVPIDRQMKSTGAGMVDARLLQIYDGERKMGDHNSVLRGSKPVVRRPPIHVQTYKENMLTSTGLLSLPQNRRAILPLTPRLETPRSAATCPRFQPHKKAQTAQPPPHHPPLALGFFAPAHLEHQILPRRRRLHPAQRGRNKQRKHDPNPAPPPLHLQRPDNLHPRRQHHVVQTHVLVACRRHFHHGPDMAVQELQIPKPRRALRTLPRRLRRVAGRGAARDDCEPRPWRPELQGRQVDGHG
jgi:hypothetical protein